MTPEEIREHAIELILSHARDVEFMSIAESLENMPADTAKEAEALEVVCQQIDNLISTATITVSWPETEVAS